MSTTVAPPTAAEISLRDGAVMLVRPPSEEDQERLVALLRSLSPSSRALRFGTAAVGLGSAAAGSLRETGLIAITREGVAVGHIYFIGTGDGLADLAVVVADAYQGRGLGTALLRIAASQARACGIHTLEAFVLPHNTRMQQLLKECGLPLRMRVEFAGTTFAISTRSVRDDRAGVRGSTSAFV